MMRDRAMRTAIFFRTMRTGVFIGCMLTVGLPLAIAGSKEPPLAAIEVYDTPGGPAVLQLGNVLFNGKPELRLCTNCSGSLEKSVYNKLDKMPLGPGGILERGQDGILRYGMANNTPSIVVPMQIKFDHHAVYTAAEMADQTTLTGNILNPDGSATAPAPLKNGVMLVFVAAPDPELGDYLLAQRVQSIPGWQKFLGKYPSTPHLAKAQESLGKLFVLAGKTAMQRYTESLNAAKPLIEQLRSAKEDSLQAHKFNGSDPLLPALDNDVQKALAAIVDSGAKEISLYRRALQDRGPGYFHLPIARKQAELVAGIDSAAPGLRELQIDLAKESDALKTALDTADSDRSSGRLDDALKSIDRYLGFASEEPRLTATIDAGYAFHLAQARQAETAPDWDAAIREYERVLQIRDNAAIRSSLRNAREQQIVFRDQKAAQTALEASKAYENENDLVHAWESLATLNKSQQAYVTADMDRLRPLYVEAAVRLASSLSSLHIPIRSLADEVAMENACNYLQDAWELTQNASYKEQHDKLADQLSSWLFDQAKHYLGFSGGRTSELGWTYLNEAASWKGSNSAAVQQAIEAATPAHALHTRIVLQQQFADPASAEQNKGLAGQAEKALASAMENSTMPVHLVAAAETLPTPADFRLDGEVMQNQLTVTPEEIKKESKYRTGKGAETATYSFTQKTVHEEGAILMQYRIASPGTEESAQKVTIHAESRTDTVMLLDVQPEDTEGYKNSASEPDTKAFMKAVEEDALQKLVHAVTDQVAALPSGFYQKARALEQENDIDNAGEAYLRYLNLAPAGDTPERRHALRFLVEQFNISPAQEHKSGSGDK